MALPGGAGMMEAIRAYGCLLALQPALKGPHHMHPQGRFHCQGLLPAFNTAWTHSRR